MGIIGITISITKMEIPQTKYFKYLEMEDKLREGGKTIEMCPKVTSDTKQKSKKE